MPYHHENVPEAMEEHPVLSPALTSTAYDWPEELVAHLEAEVATLAHRTTGGDDLPAVCRHCNTRIWQIPANGMWMHARAPRRWHVAEPTAARRAS